MKIQTTAKNAFLALFFAATLLAGTAHAGRSCEAKPPSAQSVVRGLALAEKTLEKLNASGEKVVLLTRVGQDLSKYGVHYSHVGLAYQTQQTPGTQGQTTWRVLHKLNTCGTNSADVYLQGLGEFFLDDLWRFEAAWLAPTPQVQARLLNLLQNSTRRTAMHHGPYSLVSHAWAQKYQQSNQWALETLAAAMEPSVTTREQAQAWLKFKAYQPKTITLGPLTRLGGRITAANVAFDDHPNEKRYANRIETVTVDSVFTWMLAQCLASYQVDFSLNDALSGLDVTATWQVQKNSQAQRCGFEKLG